MLEVKNLTKIYKTKGGAQVNALDDVSVRFPEKGMVFLLGKSGSGKSTLLNVTGGLDSPTSGEIIVKGRSSKNFSQSDFDSYRNTFIGFIFQEYNILNEFTVEDNIALALELQGKPKDKNAITALLEQVDLVGYAKRKPNTLSGGQKQRIAIARALIKSPEIIMADEPTGALDSATGKQVFDTLKKLSEEKLVIVVSHDREFAELYGDRIIELKDGKILSDVSKVNERQNTVSENVTVVGESTICVKDGKSLSQRDFDYIKAFLSKTDGSVMIANGEKEISDFKKVSRITDDGEKESFKETDENKLPQKSYTEADGKFIRSKLPARHAMKIGVSGLKSKPFRLFFTILLCSVAFILFGLVSTLSLYHSDATFRQSMKDSSFTSVRIEKQYRIHTTYHYSGSASQTWTATGYGKFTEAETAAYAEAFGKETFGAVDSVNASVSIETRATDYWQNAINYFAYLPEDHSLRTEITGKYPTAENEAVISSYTADMIVACKIYDKATGQTLELKSRDDVIGKTINVGNYSYTVTGIIDSGKLPEKYDKLKNGEEYNWSLERSFSAELKDGIHLVMFVSETQLGNLAARVNDRYKDINRDRIFTLFQKDISGNYDETSSNEYGFYSPVSELSASEITFFDTNKSSLSAGEIVVNKNAFLHLIDSAFETKRSEFAQKWSDCYQEFSDFCETHSSEVDNIYNWEYLLETNQEGLPQEGSEHYGLYLEWKEIYDEMSYWQEKENELSYGQLPSYLEALSYGGRNYYDEETGISEWIPLTQADVNESVDALLAWLKENEISLTLGAKIYDMKNEASKGELKEFSVVGVKDLYALSQSSLENCLWLTDEEYSESWETQKPLLEYYEETTTAYKEPSNGIYSTIFLAYDKSNAATDELVKIRKNSLSFDENDTKIALSNSVAENLEMVDDTVESMSKAFLYVGLVMAVFAALLLSNFISVSISYKKKEIGILRAVGARSLDVFKIFFSESFVIAAICIVLSGVGSTVVCNVLNVEIGASIGASLFVFGPLSILLLIGIAILTAIVATFLPVYLAARKKPVDSIRAL